MKTHVKTHVQVHDTGKITQVSETCRSHQRCCSRALPSCTELRGETLMRSRVTCGKTMMIHMHCTCTPATWYARSKQYANRCSVHSRYLIADTFGLSLRLIICSPTHRIALRSRVQQRSSVRYVCAGCPFPTNPDLIFCTSMLELLRSVVRPSCRSHGLIEEFLTDWQWER